MPRLYFDALTTGQIFKHPIRRTISEADNVFFSALTLGLMVGDTTLGTAVANLGWDEVRFPKPICHADTSRVESEVIELRESKSRPTAGIVTFMRRAYNQPGERAAHCKRSDPQLKRPVDVPAAS